MVIKKNNNKNKIKKGGLISAYIEKIESMKNGLVGTIQNKKINNKKKELISMIGASKTKHIK